MFQTAPPSSYQTTAKNNHNQLNRPTTVTNCLEWQCLHVWVGSKPMNCETLPITDSSYLLLIANELLVINQFIIFIRPTDYSIIARYLLKAGTKKDEIDVKIVLGNFGIYTVHMVGINHITSKRSHSSDTL